MDGRGVGVGANKGEASDAVSLKCIQKLTQIVTPFMDEDFYFPSFMRLQARQPRKIGDRACAV